MALGDLSEKQLLGLTAGVVGGILLVMAGVLVWTYLRYKGIKDDISRKSTVAANMRDKAKGLKDKRDEYNEARARFHDMLERVPVESQATDLDAQISEQAAMAKLKILKIELVKERSRGRSKKSTGKLEPIRLRIEAAGSFNAFGHFINNIEENMDRFVEVTGFKISAYEDGLAPGKGPHEIELDLKTYKYVGGKKPAAAAKPAATAGR